MTTHADLRRDQVLAALLEARETGLSGQVLADRLGCSRAAIHRHVEALRRAGIGVDGVHEGYRLPPDADPVSASLTQARLVGAIAGPVQWSAETGSTNDDAVAAARAGAPEGLVIGTDRQLAGRGRRGRDWVAAAGDALLFSVVLRPPVPVASVGMLPLVVAVAVANALGPDIGIVWPNDLVVEDRKLCGILCELSADEAGVGWAVAGIGLNVRGAPDLVDARWTPGSLADQGPPPARQDLIVDILNAIGAAYANWLSVGAGPTLRGFAARDRLTGRGITVAAGAHTIIGTANGTDDVGQLRVVTVAGEVALAAGEVTRVERV